MGRDLGRTAESRRPFSNPAATSEWKGEGAAKLACSATWGKRGVMEERLKETSSTPLPVARSSPGGEDSHTSESTGEMPARRDSKRGRKGAEMDQKLRVPNSSAATNRSEERRVGEEGR